MRLLTLNLRHGGKRHMPSILECLLGHGADVLVLTEYRNGPSGAVLREGLAGAGLRYQAASHGELRRNGVLIAARLAFRSAPQEPLRFDRARLLNVRFKGFSLLGLHMPNMKAKLPHWQALKSASDLLLECHPRESVGPGQLPPRLWANSLTGCGGFTCGGTR